jgi:hypothetical protein
MNAESATKWLLRFIGITTIPALVAAVMPQSWFACLIHRVDPTIPVGLLVTYLGRILMALYALIGLQCFLFATDLRRYRPLIWIVGVGSVALALTGLIALFSTVAWDQRTGFFWVVFWDFAEGLVQGLLLVILLLRIQYSTSRH